jgi:hypothetical protein
VLGHHVQGLLEQSACRGGHAVELGVQFGVFGALFEQALHMVAQHEGISLQEQA